MKLIKSGLAALMSMALVSTLVGSALGAEPGNNTLPYVFAGFRGDVQTYGAPNVANSTITFGSADAITPVNDVDYLYATCQGLPVKVVGINNFSNDLDLRVYDMSGTLIGSSTSVTSTESVDVSAVSRAGVIMKVYGYNGSTSASYAVWITC